MNMSIADVLADLIARLERAIRENEQLRQTVEALRAEIERLKKTE